MAKNYGPRFYVITKFTARPYSKYTVRWNPFHNKVSPKLEINLQYYYLPPILPILNLSQKELCQRPAYNKINFFRPNKW